MKPSKKSIISSFTVFILILIHSNLALSSLNQPIKLNQFDFLSNGSNDFLISDENIVIFNQITDFANFVINLSSTNIDGQSDTLLLTNNEFQGFGFDFLYDPDNQRVLNLAFLDNGSVGTRSSSIDGSSSIFLSTGPNSSDIDAFVFQGITSPNLDGSDFYYFVVDGNLYSIPVDGSSTAIRLSPEVTNEIKFVTPLNDQQEVIFSVFDRDSNSERIYKSPIDGSAPALLLTELPNNVSIEFIFQNTFLFNEDNSRVIFNTLSFDENSAETVQIYSLNLNTPSTAVPISSPVTGFSLSTNFSVINNTIIYSVRDGVNDISQLFSANIDGSQSPILLDQGLNIPEFNISRNENTPYVIYAKETTSGRTEIFSTLIDGSSAPKPLRTQAEEISTNSIDSFDILISEKNGLVFYISSQLNDLSFGLFVVAIDGSSPAKLISSANTSIGNIKLSNDEKSIFYISESNSPSLSKSNIDGSNFKTLVSLENGQIIDYQLSNDGNYIVYSTSDFNFGESNLFSLKLENEDSQLCFPVKAQNGNFFTVCL